jgi:hypothetical protein
LITVDNRRVRRFHPHAQRHKQHPKQPMGSHRNIKRQTVANARFMCG